MLAGAHRIFVARITSARRVRPLDSDCPDCGILAGVLVTRVGGDREKDASIVAAADSYPLRRTATFALCLLTSTEEGAEILDELGWESVFDLYSRPVGLCVPTYLADYIAVSLLATLENVPCTDGPRSLQTPLWDSPYVEAPLSLEFTPARSSLQREILISLANLSNHILASKSSRALSKLKMRHPAEFASPVMMRRAMQMLSEHQFRLTSRRFVLELFDAPLSPSLARKIARASRELVAGRANAGPPEDDDSYFAHDTPTRLRRRSSQMPSGVPESVLGAVEGDMTEDDTSSIDSTSKQVPTQVLTPLISIRGFLLA